jgi:hypothetical protein
MSEPKDREIARITRLRMREDYSLIDSLADEMAEQADRDLSFMGLLQVALENTGLALTTQKGSDNA